MQAWTLKLNPEVRFSVYRNGELCELASKTLRLLAMGPNGNCLCVLDVGPESDGHLVEVDRRDISEISRLPEDA